jgi:hypothetical protein
MVTNTIATTNFGTEGESTMQPIEKGPVNAQACVHALTKS